jgi:hypothetical protein
MKQALIDADVGGHIAKDLLGLDERLLGIALQAGEIVEIRDGGD